MQTLEEAMESSMTSESSDLGLVVTPDGALRCYWQPGMPDYHDHEWGYPVDDDKRLFEKICLEGFHSGMSWLTILRKRDYFREAFCDFDYEVIARFDEADVERLMTNEKIVRNRAKIQSAINNAGRARELVEEAGSLAAWVWKFEPAPEERPHKVDLAYWNGNPTSPSSIRMSEELKRRGWTFVGPTTVYSFMQAMGIVNDHLEGCVCREKVEEARRKFSRPT